jgi:hypothetical protein
LNRPFIIHALNAEVTVKINALPAQVLRYMRPSTPGNFRADSSAIKQNHNFQPLNFGSTVLTAESNEASGTTIKHKHNSNGHDFFNKTNCNSRENRILNIRVEAAFCR